MRMIGFVNDENDARRFCDYLLTQNVAAHAEEVRGGGWQVWIENDDQLDRGAAELVAFRADRQNPKYAVTGQAERLRKLEYRQQQRRRSNFRDVRTTMFTAQTAGAIPVSLALIAAGVAVSLLTNFGGGNPALMANLLFTLHPHHPLADIVHGQIWRLITPIFIHYSIAHILFNALGVLDFGRRIETVRGSLRFAGLVLVLGVLSCGAEAGWEWLRQGRVDQFGGLSGVLFGLFGYAWMCSRLRPQEQIHITDNEIGLTLGWLVICCLGLIGPIANAAHIGGLVFGAAFGALPGVWKRR